MGLSRLFIHHESFILQVMENDSNTERCLKDSAASLGHVRCLSSCPYITESGKIPLLFESFASSHCTIISSLGSCFFLRDRVMVSMVRQSLNLFIVCSLLSLRLRETDLAIFFPDVHSFYSFLDFLSNISLVNSLKK